MIRHEEEDEQEYIELKNCTLRIPLGKLSKEQKLGIIESNFKDIEEEED
jgi:hypothetical protein